ncbi:MAG TPA: RidA family protein [Aestuariivirga sp.]|nr:RidA family protein [Aestuariivirga sp.]
MGLIDKRLAELGIVLPTPAKPIANYVPWVKTGNLVYISGQGAVRDGKIEYTGKVGDTLPIEDAVASARLTAINIIAHLRDACGGDLDRVKRIVKLLGLVNCTPTFGDHPKVINGASDLMVEVFGDKGRHARSAVGAPSLPFGLSVEVEAIVEIE